MLLPIITFHDSYLFTGQGAQVMPSYLSYELVPGTATVADAGVWCGFHLGMTTSLSEDWLMFGEDGGMPSLSMSPSSSSSSSKVNTFGWVLIKQRIDETLISLLWRDTLHHIFHYKYILQIQIALKLLTWFLLSLHDCLRKKWRSCSRSCLRPLLFYLAIRSWLLGTPLWRLNFKKHKKTVLE